MPDVVPAPPPLPGRQREARANDTAILAAAREVFALQGHGAPISEVAQRAGVGVGSVYRRYPTKEALVEALHVAAVQEVADLASTVADARQAASGSDDARDDGAVATFLARHITDATGPLLRPPGAQSPIPPELAAASDRLRAGLDRLIALDRAERRVPDGFTPADVMQLVVHLRPPLPLPRAESDALHLRYLGLVVRGLREQAAADARLEDGPGWDEWVGAWHD
ncbi:TetR/AcrR family transcriptional regulator [Cellulosimicrobium protaetiae]|uniref:TetR/AcrR family transcriptional regulator n=1 Tax=Cellulosimicrobium protaetiae TaxID=2587808 RepID=UPI001C124C87|nr:TetR/AcrR family transcriptional regulator [Cellulosimicrobium protaetiae]